MFDAGCIQHARTTTPEFSCAAFTQSRVHGVTRNPWNPEFAVGGSSGGSGASLAAGTSTLAGGSDIGGSIRSPASFNGVVGFKAPHGRVPCEPPFGLDMYCHNGGLARTVEDMRLFQNVLAGPHAMDHRSLRPKLELPTDPGDIRGLRIAVTTDFGGGFPVDDDVARNTLAAADALRSAGAIVDELPIAIPHELIYVASAYHYTSIFGAWIAGMLAEHRDEMADYTIEFAEHFVKRQGDASGYTQIEAEAAIWNIVGPVLESHDALLCPTVGMRGLVAGDGYVGHGMEIGGRSVDFYFDGIITVLFNILSACPVLNVPSGFGDNGVPTGLQIVGRTFDDATTFAIGAALERERPWMDAPERRPMQA
jgi:Asp-tRNA(Asn)/Glu-tRNA(Gln) amidotransferase A subunit family amidase